MVTKGKGNKMEQSETLEVRMERALKAIRRAGITARRNVMSCCRSCVDLGLAGNVPVMWHFGGQGNRTAIEGNYATFSSMYFNHSNLATAEGLTESGKVVLKAFEDNGITVEWEDQSPYKCLEVILK